MVQLAKQAEIMSNKYAVVCTNPPYLNKLEGQLKNLLLIITKNIQVICLAYSYIVILDIVSQMVIPHL